MTPATPVPSQHGVVAAVARAGGLVAVLGDPGAGVSTVLDAVAGAVVWRPAPAPATEPGAVLGGLLVAAADLRGADPRPALERALRRPIRAPATVRDTAAAVTAVLSGSRSTAGSGAVVLDDLHRADTDSLALLPALVADLGAAGVTVVLGLRGEATGTSPLREVLAALPAPGWVVVPDWDEQDAAAHVVARFGVRGAPALLTAATDGRSTAATVTGRIAAWQADDSLTVVDRRVLRVPATPAPGATPPARGARDLAGVLAALDDGVAAAEAEALWVLAAAPDPAAVADAAVVAVVTLSRDGRDVEARALLDELGLDDADRTLLAAAVAGLVGGTGEDPDPAPDGGGSTTAVRWLGAVARAEVEAVAGRRPAALAAAATADALATGSPLAALAARLYPSGLAVAVRLRAGDPPAGPASPAGADAALAAVADGRFDEVVDLARESVAAGRDRVAGPPSGDDPALVATLAAEVCLARGLLVRAGAWLEEAGDAPWSARREGTRAGIDAVSADPVTAADRLADTVTGLAGRQAWRDVPVLAHRLATLAVRVGDHDRAGLALDAADRAAAAAGPGTRAAWHALLTRAAVTSDVGAATAALRAAEDRGLATEVAWSRLAVGSAGIDPTAHLRAAHATFAGIDAALWAATVARAARAVGVRLPADDPDDGPATRLLVRLVSDGLTNRRIAAVLGISERGVEARLATLTRRWGLGSRAALAREWLGREPA